MANRTISWNKAFNLIHNSVACVICSHDDELTYPVCHDEGDDDGYIEISLNNDIQMALHQIYNKSVSLTPQGTIIFKYEWDNMDPSEKVVEVELMPLMRKPIR